MSAPTSKTRTQPGFRESFDQLRQAQKTRKGVPLYLLYVNRPAGRTIAAALRYTRVAPNHVTWAGAALTYGTLLWVALWAQPTPAAALAGLLLAVGYALDSADGQLARLQGSSSAYGEWLDHLLDNGRITVMHVAAFCFLLRTTECNVVLLALGCGAFLLASSMIFFGGILFDQLAKHSGTGGVPEPVRGDRRLFVRSVVMLPVDYGVTCLAFMLLPSPAVFLAAYFILGVAHVLIGAAYVLHWRGKLLRLR